MKFIHVSNVNLGASYPSDALLSISRKEDYVEDFKRVLQMAVKEKVDCLFITGGLFQSTPDEEAFKELDEMLSVLKETQVFWIFGKEDSKESMEASLGFSFSSKVRIISSKQIERLYLSSLNTELTAISYDKETWEQLKLKGLLPGKKGAIQILLLPDLNMQDEIASGYDYMGLGGETPYLRVHDQAIYAPGLFEPQGFTDQIKHGFLFGAIINDNNRNRMQVRFIPGAKREFLSFKINTNKTVSFDDVLLRARNVIHKNGENNIYEVTLQGEASESLHANVERLKEIEGVVCIDNRTRFESVLEEIPLVLSEPEKMEESCSEVSYEFMQAVSKDVDEAVKKKALKYGIEALLETQEEGEE